MLLGGKVAVCYENRTEYTDTLCGQNVGRTSQEEHDVSATELNGLMLCGETLVYCENHTELTDTFFGHNAVRTSQETFTSLLLSPTDQCCLGKQSLFNVGIVRNTHTHSVGSPYLTADTLHFRYRAKPVKAVWGNSRCLV
jgi:hypothetical protein